MPRLLKKQIRKTGRSHEIKFQEHVKSIRHNREDSAFAKHILNNRQQYVKMEDIMDIIDYAEEGERR
jgi:hypothetical protein